MSWRVSVAAVVLLVAVPRLASQSIPEGARSAPPGASAYSPPRTAWGEPDLQGSWTTDDALNIPLQRPARFGTRTYLTDEEFAARVKADALNRRTLERVPLSTRSFRQTSLIADPPDGRLPALTPEAEQRRAPSDAGTSGPGPFDWVSDFTLMDRCITRGVVGSVLPAVNSNRLRIVQGPGVVAITHEVIHDTRLIYTDGRPPIRPSIRAYTGDSRGRWDGDTLVVETTNLTDRTSVGTNGTGPRHGMDMRLTERFTRTAADLITYEVRVEDPATYIRPFTITLPITAVSGIGVLPYECHEGNYMLANTLRGARAEDQAVADARANGVTQERTQGQLLPMTIAIAAAGDRNSPFAGTWHASIGAGSRIALTVDGTLVTGAISVVTAAAARALEVFDGRIDERTITFKVMSPDGDRTITFTATLQGDEMTFTRDVEVRPGGNPGGQSIFGSQGPRAFTARRAKSL